MVSSRHFCRQRSRKTELRQENGIYLKETPVVKSEVLLDKESPWNRKQGRCCRHKGYLLEKGLRLCVERTSETYLGTSETYLGSNRIELCFQAVEQEGWTHIDVGTAGRKGATLILECSWISWRREKGVMRVKIIGRDLIWRWNGSCSHSKSRNEQRQ